MRKWLLMMIVAACCNDLKAQDGPNFSDGTPMSAGAEASSKFMADQVNLFTGQPAISVPIFNYSSINSIGVSVGLYYTGTGGIRLNEKASSVGLGWYLGSGGVITRIVRGTPDDIPSRGFLYTPTLPADYRSNADKYHYDTLDTQQDVFQFNFNGTSGKFYIRKNKEIILVPYSKLKIVPAFDPNASVAKILSFTITTEDGIRYLFKDAESTTHYSTGMHQGYSNINTNWNLSEIISAFGVDTIRLAYTSKALSSIYGYPLTYLMAAPYTSIYKTYNYSGNQTETVKKIQSITLPDKRVVSFYYSKEFYSEADNGVLEKITISDTIFRSGFYFNYKDTANTLFLTSVVPYTAKERTKGYSFYYDWTDTGSIPWVRGTFLKEMGVVSTNVDDWGFDLGTTTHLKTNFTNNNYPSAVWQNRYPNAIRTQKGVLNKMVNPEGGVIEYTYELNDKNPSSLSYKYYSVPSNNTVTNNVNFTNSYGDGQVLSFKIDTALLRTQSPPLNGTCNFSCKIKTSAGAVAALDSTTISLFDLYYNGLKKWATNLPDGNYVMETKFLGSGSVTSSFNIYISWYNHSYIAETLPLAGLRVKQIKYKNDLSDTGSIGIKTYRYVLEDGESSGMIGELPMSYYDYRETFVNNTTLAVRLRSYYLAIGQQPMNNLDFSQGGPVGYSRVEVINGTLQKNTGKEVHEFTTLKHAGCKTSVPAFPYAPNDLNTWAVGLPLSVKAYDNAGTLRKKSTIVYSIKTFSYTNPDDRNLKLGLAQNIIFEGSGNQVISKKNVYVAEEYYPQSGNVFQTAIYDTTYNDNGSLLTAKTEMEYDTARYLVKKIITAYDRTRGLNLEKRFYYPHDYTISGVIGKLRDSGIITPIIATEQWITGDATPRILSAVISEPQQLSNNSIRPFKTYALETNKPVAGTTIGNFNPAQLNRNTTYFKQQAEYPYYDSKGNPVQITNTVTGISSSLITDYNSLYKTAEISNASYADVAYTSFESDGNGNWTVNSTQRSNTNAYSGKWAYALSNGSIVKSGLTSNKTYIVSVWGRSGASVNVNGSSIGSAVTNYNGWYLYSKTITGVTQITVSGSGTIDELRLHPSNANMVTYSYEPFIGAVAVVDANNTVLYTEYDNLNRIKVVRDRNRNVVQKYEYTDSVYSVSMLPDWIGTGYYCTGNLQYDSIYTDINPYSPTHGNTKFVTSARYGECHCMPVNYKCINGFPSQGVRFNKSTRRITVDGIYMWECTYYYMFEDCTQTQDYTEINSTACTTQTGNCNF